MTKTGLSILFVILPIAAARAEGGCEACRAEDEAQVGSYVQPAISLPHFARQPDPRGKPHKIRLPGVGETIVHVKPGDGVWVTGVGENKGNIFLKGARDKATLGWKLGF